MFGGWTDYLGNYGNEIRANTKAARANDIDKGFGRQQPGQAQPVQQPSQGTPYGQQQPWGQPPANDVMRPAVMPPGWNENPGWAVMLPKISWPQGQPSQGMPFHPPANPGYQQPQYPGFPSQGGPQPAVPWWSLGRAQPIQPPSQGTQWGMPQQGQVTDMMYRGEPYQSGGPPRWHASQFPPGWSPESGLQPSPEAPASRRQPERASSGGPPSAPPSPQDDSRVSRLREEYKNRGYDPSKVTDAALIADDDMRSQAMARSKAMAAKQEREAQAEKAQWARNAAAEDLSRRLGTYRPSTYNERFGYKPKGQPGSGSPLSAPTGQPPTSAQQQANANAAGIGDGTKPFNYEAAKKEWKAGHQQQVSSAGNQAWLNSLKPADRAIYQLLQGY